MNNFSKIIKPLVANKVTSAYSLGLVANKITNAYCLGLVAKIK